MSSVRVASFLGQEYSFRISEDEEPLFQQATALLQQKLAESRTRYPASDAQELLLMTALALCVPQAQQAEQLHQTQQRLAALIDRLQHPAD